ncbi:UDP-N-acetylmuramoyl-tripeptide--D-alanyl-D-alanine ligase [Reichenbachiella agariperforans]|uniref:UDP-N-acetylmuramoyl-tripeptide--D-alanyl-D-alanine ligase n=1 Tax=Reichenbachiella agariperforans TaxID=156994 RepID=A0A1M6TSL0_REIAG|nr:UDP-N-acetylmuramoyl-tripeptide--D-alanyl-D-alanine ligase [Reichenbachiella agariperforans]SHK59927.1 UDP-N-acetylmuramoyl-tripeptide--D-alanyl-D-alanine ligase [Reichenbachiella agariperforans]
MKEFISSLYDKFLSSTGVNTDTRSIEKGQLFFALRGDNFDGNQYAQQAIASGASYAVVDDPAIAKDDRFILVDSVLQTLQLLANHHRRQFTFPFLAITGSNGKTTTKELTARVLGERYKVHYTRGNLNNHIGVPLTLLGINSEVDFAIIEMGANHLGDISLLCRIAEPTHGLITNIGTAHIGEFGGRDNIIRAKSELFDYLRKTDGLPFINKLDSVLVNMSKRFEKSVDYPNDSCKLIEAKPYVNYLDDQDHEHSTEIIGEYNYMNIAAAVTVAKHFEVDYPYNAIDTYQPDNNRSQIVEIGSNTIILDAYNANPDSMKAALRNLANMNVGKKIAMLGEMKELGDYTMVEHERIVSEAEELGIKNLYLVGNEFKKASEFVHVLLDVDRLIDYLREDKISGATVLIKGSRSMQMERLIQNKEIWD